jgi:predicted short-subunit dehydrogenase-like oxidoreductase (DUF2520 family)
MRIFIIGTGNAATAIGKAFVKAGHSVTGVYGRNRDRTTKLSGILKCKAYFGWNEIPRSSQVYLIAVKDDAIAEVARHLPALNGIVIHTSGTTPLSVLSRFSNHGVFYPVETMASSVSISFRKVPLCLEASNEKALKNLMTLASTVSEKIFVLESQQRLALHIAAVFTNNFTNHLLTIATEIINKEHLPVELLEHLAATTVKNAFINGPMASQTGPARRNDRVTINKHLSYLKFNDNFLKIYKMITEQIYDVHNKIKK